MVGEAEAALGSLTWDRGLQAITQHGLQAFLWHELPRKWLTDRRQTAHRRFAGAVAGAGRAGPLHGDLPWAPDRRGAAGLRGRRPGGLPGVPPGAGALRGGAAGPARAAAVVGLGAGDGRGRPVPSSRWRRRWSLRSPAAGCAPAPGAGARPSRRSPAGTWRLPGRSWMGGAAGGGGGGGRAASARARSRGEARRALVDPVLPRLAAGRCCRSRSRPARLMAPAIGGGDGEAGSASAPARRQLIFVPGSWRELAGGSWSQWNLWFCTVAVPGLRPGCRQLAGEATHDLVEALLWSLAAELRGSGLATPPRSPWDLVAHLRAPPPSAWAPTGGCPSSRWPDRPGRRTARPRPRGVRRRQPPRPSAELPGRAIPGAHRPATTPPSPPRSPVGRPGRRCRGTPAIPAQPVVS